jgi:FkbM family methyltransferase
MDFKIISKQLTTFLYRNFMYLYFLINNLTPFFHRDKDSYSDFNEDVLISEILGSKNLSYIDIGAGHPIIGNNTYYFYKKGCIGITVEPIKFHYLLHKLFRKNDIQVNKLVSNNHAKTKFYEFSPTQYSTISESQYLQLYSAGMRERKSYYLESIPVNEILQRFTNSNYFMSIDVEGFDSEIIKSINWDLIFKPAIIIFEVIKNNEDRLLVDSILKNNGYELVKRTKNNNIYGIKTR